MKRIVFLVLILSVTIGTTFANSDEEKSKSETVSAVATTKESENKMSDEELNRITKRIEEIRALDKSEMTSVEKRELRKEVREMKKEVRKKGATIYIGSSTLLIILLLIIIL